MPQCTLEVRLYNYVHVMNHDIILTEIEYVDIFSQPLKKRLTVSPLSKFVYIGSVNLSKWTNHRVPFRSRDTLFHVTQSDEKSLR